MENESRQVPGVIAELDPIAVDPTGFNRHVSQLREVQRERDDNSALSVAIGEAVVAVEVKQAS